MDFDITTGQRISREYRSSDMVTVSVGERFFKIWDFMIFSLNLQGSELGVYAIIFAMYYNYRTYFSGSRNYLATWTGTSLRTIATVLKSLEEKGLIDKLKRVIGGKERMVYHVNVEMLPTCKTLASANLMRDKWQEYRAELKKQGKTLSRDDFYRAMEEFDRDFNSERFAEEYVANRQEKTDTYQIAT